MKVTIVVPSYNQGLYIRRTMDSLVTQALDTEMEVIVQDGGSNDGTLQILDEYRHYPFIRIFVEEDSGQSDALNRGFRRATGAVLGWLNSDDTLMPEAIKSVKEVFSSNPGTDLVYGEALFIDEHDHVVGVYPTGKLNLDSMRHRCVVSQPSTFFSHECFKKHGLLRSDLHYCMDYEYWTRLLVKGANVKQAGKILSCTRIHQETKTNTGGQAFIKEIVAMQNELLGDASPIWDVYLKTRSKPLVKLNSKALRFILASMYQMFRSPSFLVSAGKSLAERKVAEYRSRKLQ